MRVQRCVVSTTDRTLPSREANNKNLDGLTPRQYLQNKSWDERRYIGLTAGARGGNVTRVSGRRRLQTEVTDVAQQPHSTKRAGIQRVTRTRIDVAWRRVRARWCVPWCIGARRGGPVSALLGTEVLRRDRKRHSRAGDETGARSRLGKAGRCDGSGADRYRGRDERRSLSHRSRPGWQGCAARQQ
jgi:hypothetical protein